MRKDDVLMLYHTWERYTPDGYFCDYPAYWIKRDKREHWKNAPHNLIAEIRSSTEVITQLIMWSEDQARQEKIRARLDWWAELEEYYLYLTQKVQVAQDKIKEEKRQRRNEARKKPRITTERERFRNELRKYGLDIWSHNLAGNIKHYKIITLDSKELVAGGWEGFTAEQMQDYIADLQRKNEQKTADNCLEN